MQRNNFSIGVLLIGIAVVLILGKLGVFSFLGYIFWPLIVLAVGLGLHFLFFSKVLPSGVLVPGGMLVTYSVLFFLCNLFGWHWMKYLWPFFIFGVAVGLYELYLFDRNSPRQLWLVSIVLAVISAVFFALMFIFTGGIYVVAAILLAAGLFMVLRRPKTW
ncbi:Uncharacterised protein [Chlamydia abortus]|jgi:hypothetical protein|uniref:DUF5668 domain-containing protein n=1 Tax=Paenibacillus residui TaxID=629724 RepID=A0ABW3DBE7_9BACL|nr:MULTISPECIES: hypothetical protein [Paenibacillaceae]SHE10434.1 Uncharacterised protein [Chlamydia abortus]